MFFLACNYLKWKFKIPLHQRKHTWVPSCHNFLAFKVPPEQWGHSWGACARIDPNRNSSNSPLYKTWNNSLCQTCFEFGSLILNMLSHWFYFVVHVYFIALNLSIKVIYLIPLKLHWVEYMEYTCVHNISIWLYMYFKHIKIKHIEHNMYDWMSNIIYMYIFMYYLWKNVICACYR